MGNSFRRRASPSECKAVNGSSHSMYEACDGKYISTFKCSEEFEIGSIPRPCGVYEACDGKPVEPYDGKHVLRRSDRALKINLDALR